MKPIKRMNKVLKVAIIGVGTIVMLAGVGVGALAMKRPAQRPASTEVVLRTPERLARGTYLVEHVSHCLGCHSGLDTARFGLPPKAGEIGQGGLAFDERFGVPGVVCAQNITPDPDTGIGRWTDGEVMRAFREGVDRDGQALFPMMPYRYFHAMSDEDARSVVVYLRALAPVHHAVPKKNIHFPVNFLIKWAPQPEGGPVETPTDAADHHAYGEYLVSLAACRECHTQHDDHGKLLAGREFAGGWKMAIPAPDGGVVHVSPPNITPDHGAYFGTATKEMWIGRVRAFASQTGDRAPVVKHGFNSVMPWAAFAGMTDADLGAIYDYLQTVPPIQNKVDPFPDAAK